MSQLDNSKIEVGDYVELKSKSNRGITGYVDFISICGRYFLLTQLNRRELMSNEIKRMQSTRINYRKNKAQKIEDFIILFKGTK